jgi:hypothetical protein
MLSIVHSLCDQLLPFPAIVHSTVRSVTHCIIRLVGRSFVCSLVHSSDRSFISLFVRSFIRLFVCSFVRFLNISVRSSLCQSLRSQSLLLLSTKFKHRTKICDCPATNLQGFATNTSSSCPHFLHGQTGLVCLGSLRIYFLGMKILGCRPQKSRKFGRLQSSHFLGNQPEK